MAEAPKHLLTELTDQIASNPQLVGIEGEINVNEEREPKEGDIDGDALDTIEVSDGLAPADKDRIVKIINLLADKKAKTGREMFFDIMAIIIEMQAEKRTAVNQVET